MHLVQNEKGRMSVGTFVVYIPAPSLSSRELRLKICLALFSREAGVRQLCEKWEVLRVHTKM